jgi:hypothetical protein
MGCAHDIDTDNNAGCNGQTATRSPYTPLPTATPVDIKLSAARRVRVDIYRVVANRHRAHACGSVVLRHEVTLARRGAMVLREVREYYADDGTLIANNSEDVSEQLQASGRYARTTTLPIPAATPVGRYRVVTKLLVKKPGERRFVQLGRAATSFYVE